VELVPVSTAAPTRITPSRRVKPTREDEVTVFIPDMQIGYRGEETFHDEVAMALGQTAIRELQPDRVVFLGDNIDLPSLSKYDQRPDWQRTTQASLDRFHQYLAQTRANAPDAEIVVLEGNHCHRLEKNILKYNAEIYGLKQADLPEGLGVLTLRHLLRTDELGVQYITGYPNGQYWIEDNLKAMHGTVSGGSGGSAVKLVNRNEVSVVFGHNHKVEMQYRTIAMREGARMIVAACFGTLARVDGGVPGGNYTVDEHGETVLQAPNWQQAVGVAFHNPSSHKLYPLMIDGNSIDLFGKTFYHVNHEQDDAGTTTGIEQETTGAPSGER
jgi:hypothetical protein